MALVVEEVEGPEHTTPVLVRQAERSLWPCRGTCASGECLGNHHCCLSPAPRQKLHEADLELQRKREYIEELEPPADSSSERALAVR